MGKYLKCSLSLFILSIGFCCTGWCATNKVLIVGIDGCRPDALLSAETPNIDKIWQSGSFSFHAGTYQGHFRLQQRHRLTLHIAAHQGTVCIVML